MEKPIHNYDVSFHNEIWTSAFSGKFAAGTSWHWERVFWWEDLMPVPPGDPFDPFSLSGNPFQSIFTNAINSPCSLNVGVVGAPVLKVVHNRPVHHHFKPLADLFSVLGQQPEQLLAGYYSAHRIHSMNDQVECFYLTDGITTAGWVHNLNAWTMNNYYLASGSQYQNFLGCDPPSLQPQEIEITGLAWEHDFHISWFPTRMDITELPADDEDLDQDGTITLRIDNPASAAFGGISNNYLDTLHADYAFIITPWPLVKGLPLQPGTAVPPAVIEWDFSLYPNPTRGELFVRLPDDVPKQIVLQDLSGRLISEWSSITGPVRHLPIDHLAQGIYWVRVSDDVHSKAKKLIIH